MAKAKRRIEYAYELAQINLERARMTLSQVPDFDSRLMDDVLPTLPDIDFASNLPLYPTAANPVGIFASRRDYEQTLRYIDRINRDASASYSGEALTPLDVERTSLTSFYINEDTGEVVQSEFMRRESQYLRRRENQRRIAALKEMGIEMVRTPAYTYDAETGEMVPVRDSSGHVVTVYSTATPSAEQRMFYALKRENNLRPLQPELPDGAFTIQWGDIKQIGEVPEFIADPKRVAKSMQEDYKRMMQTHIYFANMQEILDAVLPSPVSDRLDPVFEQIMRESPERMYEIYQAMAGRGEYTGLEDVNEFIVDLEWLYTGISSDTTDKMVALFNALESRILPMLSNKDIELPYIESADDFDELISESLSEVGDIYATYRELKKAGTVKGVTYDMVKAQRGGR